MRGVRAMKEKQFEKARIAAELAAEAVRKEYLCFCEQSGSAATERYFAAKRLSGQLGRAMMQLSREERRVLEAFFFEAEPYPPERLSEELLIERSSVYRLREKAMLHLDKVLFYDE